MRLNNIIWNKGPGKIGIIATGKAYAETRQALTDLSIDENYAEKLGIHLLKIGMPWPLEESIITEFCKDIEEVIVLEEKRPLLEDQIKNIMFNQQNKPKHIIGKLDENYEKLIPSTGELMPDFVSEIIAERITKYNKDENILNKLRLIKQKYPDTTIIQGIASRTPYFCSGCPHNTSTKVPEGSKAMAGIGCHFMAAWMDRDTNLFTHMGGEGANWIGMSRYVEDKHIFQNIGDGTYTHSGILAVRAAISAKTNITYKILFNDATAILAGDALHDLAFEILSNKKTHKDSKIRVNLIEKLSITLGSKGLAGGQSLDLLYENKNIKKNQILQMYSMKTSALFSFCCVAPFILAEKNKKDIKFAEEFGNLYGLIFQILDDINDETENFLFLGKTPGKDRRQGKSTFVSNVDKEKAIIFCNKKINKFIKSNKKYFNRWKILEDILSFEIKNFFQGDVSTYKIKK